MSAHTFKIILDDLFEESHEIVDTSIYNQKEGSQGKWVSGREGRETFWKLISEKGIVGSSGALRIRPRNNPDDVYHVVAFGNWQHNNKPWWGAVSDLNSGDTAESVLPKFYGNGEYQKEGVYWTQDPRGFKVTGRSSHEEISFVSFEDFQSGAIEVSISIMRTWN